QRQETLESFSLRLALSLTRCVSGVIMIIGPQIWPICSVQKMCAICHTHSSQCGLFLAANQTDQPGQGTNPPNKLATLIGGKTDPTFRSPSLCPTGARC